MGDVLGDLATAARKLSAAGIEYFVVTADHGHLFGLRKGDDMKTDAPGGQTVGLHRRCWIGRGGETPAGTQRVTAARLGYDSDLDFVFPIGGGVLKAGGDLSFHHGGVSLQEMVIPVLSFRLPGDKRPEAPGRVRVKVRAHEARVTNRMIVATLKTSTDDLFAPEAVPLRVVLQSDQGQVGRTVFANVPDFDRETGIVQMKPKGEVQVVLTLTRDDVDSLRIVVLDPESLAELDRSPALSVDLMVR